MALQAAGAGLRALVLRGGVCGGLLTSLRGFSAQAEPVEEDVIEKKGIQLRGAPMYLDMQACLPWRLQPASQARGCGRELRATWAARRHRSTAASRRRQPAARDGTTAHPRRDKVLFLPPGSSAPLPAKTVTQRDLDSILSVQGAYGFEADDGNVSRRLEDLPEHGPVRLVVPAEPSFAQQVRSLQQTDANSTRGKEQELRAFLQSMATSECPGCDLRILDSAPFKTPKGQDYVQLDAAVVAGNTVYVGDHKRMLGEWYVGELGFKLTKLRVGLTRGLAPGLAAALEGVTHAKLFLSGEAVHKDQAMQELLELAHAEGVSVVLPSGEGLGVAGAAPAAVPL